jgi:hypothetical protein
MSTQKFELPDLPVVSLTHVVTWLLDGRARSDEEVALECRQIEKENSARWACHLGPSWLKPHLQRLQSAKTTPTTVRDELIADVDPEEEARFARWLKRRHGNTREANKEVCEAVQTIQDAEVRSAQLYDKLFTECAWGRMQLDGIDARARRHSWHEPILADYFLRGPAYHIMGKGYHGLGQLGPDLSSRQFFDQMFNSSPDGDPRKTYIQVRIRRSDALQLKEEFRSPGSQENMRQKPRTRYAGMAVVASSIKAKTDCWRWLMSVMKQSPKEKPRAKESYWKDARPKFPGLSRRSFETAWTQAAHAVAPSWSSAGAPRGKRRSANEEPGSAKRSKIAAPAIAAAK